MQRTDSYEKTLMLGKIEGRRRRGWQKMKCLEGITNSWSLLKLRSIESVLLSNHLILCRPLLLPPSIFPSISVFSNELALRIRWPKYWASASVLPMNIQDWFPLDWLVWSPCCPRESQESYSAPHFESINSSALGFFYSPAVTSIHDYWKTIALTRQTFVSNVVTLLFNIRSRFVIAFLPRSKHLLISWLPSPLQWF